MDKKDFFNALKDMLEYLEKSGYLSDNPSEDNPSEDNPSEDNPSEDDDEDEDLGTEYLDF